MPSNGLPNGWREAALAELGEFSTSSVDKKVSAAEKPVRLVNYMDVYRHDFIDCTLALMQVTATTVEMTRSQVRVGDLLFTPSSETPDDIGHSAVVVEELPRTLHSYHTVRLRPWVTAELHARFCGRVANTSVVLKHFAQRAKGSTRYTLSLADFRSAPVRLPPLPEQRRIAEILDTLDEAIRATERLFAKLQQMKQGLLHDLLTRGIDDNGELRDPVRHPEQFKDSPLGRIPRGWIVAKLASAADVLHGYAFDGAFFSDEPVGPVLLTPGNFHRAGGLYFTERNTKWFGGKPPPGYFLAPGDIVTVMTDLSPRTLILGRTVVLSDRDRLLHNQRIGKVVLRSASDWIPEFLAEQMSAPTFRRRVIVEATGTTVRHTSPGRMKSNPIMKPPIDEQAEIVSVMRAFATRLRGERATHDRLSTLKLGLMDDLLTGRVRVEIPTGAA